MKILVPTDFSECADYALNAACQMALLSEGDIMLFHVASMPEILSGNGDDKQLTDDLKERMTSNIKELMQQRESMIQSVGVKVKPVFRFGNFIELINSFDEEENFDLVVMGSFGSSGKKEWFIGSNTQKVVREIRKNVLVIKNPISHLNFDRVMFPSNLTESDKEAFIKFLRFIEECGTKEVHVLAINTGGWFNQPTPLMMEVLEDFKALVPSDLKCETHFYSDYSIEAGIRHFAEKFDIKLIGMSNLVKHPVKRFLQGSNVEMLVNNSDIPVLAINHK